MAIFEYKAKDKKGKIIQDIIEAPSRKQAATVLRDQNLQVLIIRETKQAQAFTERMRKVSTIEKAIFCRYLSTMMKAGLPLAEAVEIMAKEARNLKMHRILRDLQYSLQRGEKLSNVFSRYPEVFDSVFITLTKAGEESGTLEQSFDYLAKQLMKSYELSQKVKGALLYPAVIIAAMIGVGVVMITFVLPRISKVFIRLNINLPLPTRILLAVSNFLGDNYLLVLGGFMLSAIGAAIFIRLPKTRNALLRFTSKLPLLSQLFDQLDLARFSRTLSTLLKSGVPIIDSIKVTVNLLTQKKFYELGKTFEEEIQKGRSLSDAIAKGEGVFPALTTQSIRAGERSGSLEVVLEELADFYEQEVEYTLKSFTSILEPVLMLAIGVAVGAMVISIIAPIYSIIGSLQPQQPGL
jgi:type IV pilus assembly protein PilC